MSKESAQATTCVCGQRIAFPIQHMPHCPRLRAAREALNLPAPPSKSQRLAYSAVK